MDGFAIGWVRRAFPDRGYGFISTDADPEKQYFFRVQNTRDKRIPDAGVVVKFRPVAQQIEGKNDRAIHVEVM